MYTVYYNHRGQEYIALCKNDAELAKIIEARDVTRVSDGHSEVSVEKYMITRASFVQRICKMRQSAGGIPLDVFASFYMGTITYSFWDNGVPVGVIVDYGTRRVSLSYSDTFCDVINHTKEQYEYALKV